MVDLGFLGDANAKGGGAKLLFGRSFPENCMMKMKGIEPRGEARVTGAAIASANA